MLSGSPENIAPRIYPHRDKTLLIDRAGNELYAAPHAQALAWLQQENGGQEGIPQIVDRDRLADALSSGRIEFHIDDAEIERRVAEMERQLGEMHAWLNQNTPPPPLEMIKAIDDDLRTYLQDLMQGYPPA